MSVENEPTTYGPGSPNSYFADFVRAQSPAWSGHFDAVERLLRASHEASKELRNGKKKSRRAIERLIREEHREGNAQRAQEAIERARALGSVGRGELRAMSSGASSGGSFVTPIYFVAEYAPYRQFGRVFVDQANKQELPDYGMAVYLPALSGPAGVASQTEGSAVTETDPTAGYLSAALTTEAGEVVVSQQLIDRAGPNFAFDRMVFDQLNRALAASVDPYVVNTALANAGQVSYTGSFALTAANGASSFYTKVAAAKAATVDAAGTVLPATHLFAIPNRWEYVQAYTDGQARPLVVPSYASPFNATAGGSDGQPLAEGFTGYRMQGLEVYEDGNIPLIGTANTDQVIVAHMPEVWVWEGTPVPRVIPQTLAQNLQVLLQLYEYITAIVRYPKAVQTINGSAMTPPTF